MDFENKMKKYFKEKVNKQKLPLNFDDFMEKNKITEKLSKKKPMFVNIRFALATLILIITLIISSFTIERKFANIVETQYEVNNVENIIGKGLNFFGDAVSSIKYKKF